MEDYIVKLKEAQRKAAETAKLNSIANNAIIKSSIKTNTRIVSEVSAVDSKIVGSNVYVSETEPTNKQVNDVWIKPT